MKSIMTMLLMAVTLLAGSLAIASDGGISESAALVTMSTQGPDCYADGTMVLDGESYALVWQSRKLGSVRFTATGEIADGADAAVLRILPLAKGGRCPKTVFAVESAKLPTLVGGDGCLRLYLLDTRGYSASGEVSVQGAKLVQGSAPVTAAASVTFSQVTGAEEALAFATSVLGGDVPQPKITNIRVTATMVVLSVASTVASVNYTAIDHAGADVAANPVTGQPGTIEITIPRDPAQASGLFRVTRKAIGDRQ